MKQFRTILILGVLAFTGCTANRSGAQNTYDFTITSEAGPVLGTGKIHLPFKLGSNGEGNADWTFTPTKTVSTNNFWLKAKTCLASGSGKAKAKCKDSWFTLDFNPGTQDNNVVVTWPLKEHEAGDLEYADFAGGHSCGFFRISRTNQTNAPPRVERSTDLGFGFRRVVLAEPSQSSFESIGHLEYLYFGDRHLCQVGACSVSPSGRYAAYQDGPSGNLFLFCAADGKITRLTSQFVALVETFDFHEDAHSVEAHFAPGKPAQTFALP